MNGNNRLANWTTWGVGGPADAMVIPSGLDELIAILKNLNHPPFWLGQGSNLLVRDAGIRDTVIVTRHLKSMRWEDKAVYAETGAFCAHLAKFAAQQGLSGLEFLAGIPGSIGGALKMNAGCFGSETWQYVKAVKTIDHQGNVRVRSADDFCPSYRKIEGPKNEWFLGAWFVTHALEEPVLILERMQKLIQKRRALQPIGEKSAGSVFKNPRPRFAGELIEACGLKGKQLGGAKISDRHANFIVNRGKATAYDIEQLILLIQEEVKKRFDICLEPEVQIVGEKT